MANYQTPESKKQEFRKYLEKSGVIDAFTKGKIIRNERIYLNVSCSQSRTSSPTCYIPCLTFETQLFIILSSCNILLSTINVDCRVK